MVKVVKQTRNDKMPVPFHVSSATVEAMDGYVDHYSGGKLEQLEQRVSNHASFVGELVEKLVERGTLDAETLQYLLGSDFKVSE